MNVKGSGISINDIILTALMNDGVIPVASYDEFNYLYKNFRGEGFYVEINLTGVDYEGKELKFTIDFPKEEFDAFMNNLSYDIYVNGKRLIIRR